MRGARDDNSQNDNSKKTSKNASGILFFTGCFDDDDLSNCYFDVNQTSAECSKKNTQDKHAIKKILGGSKRKTKHVKKVEINSR
jgi:hypothetical protein